MSLQGFFGRETWGARVRHQHHMYKMVLSGFPKKKLNLAHPILYKFFFLHMFSGGPDSITLVSSKTTHFFEGGFMMCFSLLALP